jgi:hypothetical protein
MQRYIYLPFIFSNTIIKLINTNKNINFFCLINIFYEFFFLFLTSLATILRQDFSFFMFFFQYIYYFILFLIIFVLNNCMNIVVRFFFHMIFFFFFSKCFEYYRVLIYINLIIL